MTTSIIFLSLLISMLCSCPYHEKRYNYDKGTLPETAAPLTGANSPYDDFNSGVPPKLMIRFPLYFSSNRATQGGTFDVESFYVQVDFDRDSGQIDLHVVPDPYSQMFWPFLSPWQSLNSAGNEFCPYFHDLSQTTRLYLFASDRNGSLDIFHALYDTNAGLGPVEPSSALNSPFDDAYPSFGPDNSIYFSSNRHGDYDIFSAPVPAGQDVMGFLRSAGVSIVSVDSVNSAGDEKAPFVNGKLMVFASNRPGGYGGYDLWYSMYGEGGWSQPVNFGPAINTAFDEFRPVVIFAEDYTNDLMLFSSNRPEGSGGFDLYYVGIPKMTQ